MAKRIFFNGVYGKGNPTAEGRLALFIRYLEEHDCIVQSPLTDPDAAKDDNITSWRKRHDHVGHCAGAIFDITVPDIQIGVEIQLGIMANKPILLLYNQDINLYGPLMGHPKVRFYPYEALEPLKAAAAALERIRLLHR